MAKDFKPVSNQDDAAIRAEERRRKEAEAKQIEADAAVEADIAKAKREQEKAKAAEAAIGKVQSLRSSLGESIATSQKTLEALKEREKTLSTAIGDAQGAIITAGDVMRVDPVRALAGIERAVEAFKNATK